MRGIDTDFYCRIELNDASKNSPQNSFDGEPDLHANAPWEILMRNAPTEPPVGNPFGGNSGAAKLPADCAADEGRTLLRMSVGRESENFS